uniref:acetyl-CoA C-acyltransferase n=1 Tax=Bicosoecida sp. CB-2014 TaxID=1486930 RepID=A0A7S1CLW5_9STRA
MSGTIYKDLIAQDLGRMAIKGLLTKTAVDPAAIDYVTYGTVIQEVRTSNIARESALAAGIPDKVPAHTVTLACISSNVALSTAAEKILTGQASSVVAGGAETMSDVPIRFSRPMRERLIKASKLKSPKQALPLLKGFKLGWLAPEAPAIAEFSTGEVMGHSSDRLAAKFGVTREEQDKFALRSHQNAAKAHKEGLLDDEIIPYNGDRMDNGIKGESTYEKLASLKPAFIRPHGTHTAANASFLTDGASAALVMDEEAALAQGFTPKAVLRDWTFVSQDPGEELLLGPAYAMYKLLGKNGLTLADIDVFELHEAFAGQVLANLVAVGSDKFATESAGAAAALGAVPFEKLNTLGGSLSIGHPFGATGTRLVTTTANRLIREEGTLGLVAACAAGGQGVAMLIERWAPKAAAGKAAPKAEGAKAKATA